VVSSVVAFHFPKKFNAKEAEKFSKVYHHIKSCNNIFIGSGIFPASEVCRLKGCIEDRMIKNSKFGFFNNVMFT
jgi:hypothetical protein